MPSVSYIFHYSNDDDDDDDDDTDDMVTHFCKLCVWRHNTPPPPSGS